MDIVGVIFPVFAVAILGYGLAAFRVLRPTDVAGLTRFVFSVALPIMLFHSMATVELPDQFRWSFMIAYYGPAVLIFALAAAVGRRVFGFNRPERAVFAMAAGYSNTVLIGLPVITSAWGDQALLPLLSIIAVHSAIIFSLTTALAESHGAGGRERRGPKGSPGDEPRSRKPGATASAGDEPRTARSGLYERRTSEPETPRDRPSVAQPDGKKPGTPIGSILRRTIIGMLTNPIVVGLALGLAANAAGITLPRPMDATMQLIRRSAVPLALIVTGASLREYRVVGHLGASTVIILCKMVLHPALVWLLAFRVFDVPPLWGAVAVVTAALPTGINASIFARKYHSAVAPVVTATLLATLLSMVTVSVLLAVLAPSVGVG